MTYGTDPVAAVIGLIALQRLDGGPKVPDDLIDAVVALRLRGGIRGRGGDGGHEGRHDGKGPHIHVSCVLLKMMMALEKSRAGAPTKKRHPANVGGAAPKV